MKKMIILLLMLMLSNSVFALDRGYFGYANSPYQRAKMRPVYNPYSNSYKNPYYYRKYNANNAKRIQRMNKIRQLNRIKNNFLSWNFNRNNNQNNGVLTGYSVPVQSNVYNQINSDIFDFDKKFSSPNSNTNLFATPSGSEYYFNDGRYFRNFNETQGKTGVTIIYD